MTKKMELLAACHGKHLDKVPYGPRIDLWYNYHNAHGTLPERYQGWSMIDILRDLGVGGQKRHYSVVKEEIHGIEVEETHDPPYTRTTYTTPYGTVTSTLLFNPFEGAWIGYESEKLFKSDKDYDAIRCVIEHITPVPDPAYEHACEEVGEDGLVMSGIRGWSAPQRVMREIMGYEMFFYELMDHPKQVEELIEVMKELDRKKLQLVLDTDIELVNVCGNWSDDIHTPVFRKYFIPWFKEVNAVLHAHDKLSMAHIDGENRRLLPLLRETDIDVWEAWTPYPMTKDTTAQLREAVGPQGVIWGGIPSILFDDPTTDEEFDDFIVNTLFKEAAPGYNFIIGMGDNLPFDGKLERVQRVAQLIEEHGTLPIDG